MLVKVKVTTSSRKETLRKREENSFALSVREEAERGLANKRVIQILRAHFGHGSSVRIVSGHHSTSKIVSVEMHK